MPSATRPITKAIQLSLVICFAISTTFSRNSAGSAPISIPIKSFNCPTAIVNAIPAVKPSVIVCGMNLIRLPTLQSPNIIINIPAIMVATISPLMSYSWMIP